MVYYSMAARGNRWLSSSGDVINTVKKVENATLTYRTIELQKGVAL
jgi:hypothetical protein